MSCPCEKALKFKKVWEHYMYIMFAFHMEHPKWEENPKTVSTAKTSLKDTLTEIVKQLDGESK